MHVLHIPAAIICYIDRVYTWLTGLIFIFIFYGCRRYVCLIMQPTMITNTIGRSIQNWTGTDGIIEIYAGEKLVKRFLQIDKLSTATGTNSGESRPYRFGYGILDANLNGKTDSDEKKVYFEFSDYSTSYIFYENPA